MSALTFEELREVRLTQVERLCSEPATTAGVARLLDMTHEAAWTFLQELVAGGRVRVAGQNGRGERLYERVRP